MATLNPINPNDAHTITHALYAGATGAGKSQATQKMKLIKPSDQVVFWDLYGQYKNKRFLQREVRTYSSLSAFTRALAAGRRTKQGFKIAYTPPNPPKAKKEIRKLFLDFCAVVWGFGNGKHPKILHAVLEEINRVTISAGDEDSIYGELLEAARKYGIMLHNVSQRLAPIPNTVISMCGYKWIGYQNLVGDVERVAREIGVSNSDIMSLNKLEYYFKSEGFGNVKRGKLKF